MDGERERRHPSGAERGEGAVDEGTGALGRVALAPGGAAQPVAELRLVGRDAGLGTQVEPAEELAAVAVDRPPRTRTRPAAGSRPSKAGRYSVSISSARRRAGRR